MKISNDWLRQYLTTDADLDTLSNTLTEIGLEVEGIEEVSDVQAKLNGVVVAEIQEVNLHPDADKLKVCQVFDGTETYNIVCGAPNVRENAKVALAKIGTQLTLKDGTTLKIKKSKIRGVASYGMLCSEEELGLSDNHDGILILKEDSLLGEPLKKSLSKYTDDVFEIGLTPNRTDAMSHYGVARDLHAGLQSKNITSKLSEIKNIEDFDNPTTPSYSVEIDTEDCEKYALARIDGVSISDSPEWLQNKLKAIGIEPKNNVVDVTNYLLHSYGQPLHAFDADKIAENKIIVGKVTKQEEFTTLDKTDRKLQPGDLVIQDGNKKPIALAGVIGGLDSAVSVDTKDIVLESAYFNPVAVRKTAKRHGLNTDASFRFERGADPEITLTILKKACDLILQLAGGEMNEEFVYIDQYKDERPEIFLRMQTLNSIIGNNIHRATIKQILHNLDFDIIEETDLGYVIKAPTFRVDVTREIDVVEEVLRIYGYNNIEASEKFNFSLSPAYNVGYIQEKNASEYLSKNGFLEVMNSSISSTEDKENEVQLLNPLSSDIAFMRTTCLNGILENIAYNLNRNQNNLKFYEFGKIYFKEDDTYVEKKRLSIAISGDYYTENWISQSNKDPFFLLKGICTELLTSLQIKVKEFECEEAIFSNAIRLMKGKEEIALLGKVSKEVLKNIGISQDVFWADINWDLVCATEIKRSFKLKAIPKFPGSRRDLALLLDKDIEYKDLEESAKKVNNTLLKEVNLFDVYEGKNLPDNKKSYALSYWFSDSNKTITDKEINPIMDKIIKEYENKYNAELRK